MGPLNRGWTVVLSGLGITLALGGLYTWGVIARALTRPASEGGSYLWTAQQANMPFAVALGSFTLTMVFAGWLQDRVGPRWTATAGGAMVGVGMIVASLSPTRLSSVTAFPSHMVVGFGLFTGAGIGLAYASATPAAVKWFPTGRKGLAGGVVVSGFGLAAVLTTPLTTLLIRTYGISESFLFLGVVLFVVIVGLAQLLADPPVGYVPPGTYAETIAPIGPRSALREYTWQQVIRTRSFYVLWVMYACSAFAALVVIAILARIVAPESSGSGWAAASYTLVSALALGSGFGAPILGLVSDRLGRQHTMLAVLVLQAVLIGGLRFATVAPMVLVFAFLIGCNCGAILTLFPVTVFDFFGTKNGGVGYGLLFTAWGAGVMLGARATSWLLEGARTVVGPGGSVAVALWIPAALCLAAAGLTFILRPPDSPREYCPVVSRGGARQA